MNKHSHTSILIIETAPGEIEIQQVRQISEKYAKDTFRITSNSPNSNKIAQAFKSVLSRYSIESKTPITV